MSEHLTAAAAAMGVPESMVKRSAEARAKATGASVEDVLAAWAGGGDVPSAASTPQAPEPEPTAEEQAAPPEVPTEDDRAPESAPAPAPAAATPATPSGGVVTPPPTPTSVTPEQAVSYPVVVSVPTAGLKERTAGALPRWLAAAFMVVPAFGLIYLSSNMSSSGCVEGGYELAIDRATGVVENCDGTNFEGRGGASGAGGALLASGGEIYASAGCAGCHGAGGGGGTGPAFTNVLLTFGSCADHIEWVLLGSSGFQAAGRNTYGDLAKPIAGGMPPHPSLTEEQLGSVVAFERTVFGGGVAEEVLVDCGLVEGEAADDGAATDDGTSVGEAPTDEGTTTETTADGTSDGEAPTDEGTTETTVSGEARVGANG